MGKSEVIKVLLKAKQPLSAKDISAITKTGLGSVTHSLISLASEANTPVRVKPSHFSSTNFPDSKAIYKVNLYSIPDSLKQEYT